MRSYASSEGSHEPAHLQKIVRALTPHIHMKRIKMTMYAYSPARFLFLKTVYTLKFINQTPVNFFKDHCTFNVHKLRR